MKKNEQLHGFTVQRVRPMKDCSGTLYEMTHDRTGAQLCWLQRKDRNMTFSVAFKTIPENDTGVFHILEHSVLNGSEKYPVREPFVELLKGSMQTFLNAMTYPDKTLYPVSSRNQKDFMNLMSVYLDAVFHPAIMTNPLIFYQEGWHYEIHQPQDTPIYNGVVFNEMKGAFSSVDELIINECNRMLYPDNCYRFVSGGDPEKIPELSYEQFLAAHRKYYHPSNARFFLDGDLDIDAVLSMIDGEYLAKAKRLPADDSIPLQQPVSAVSHTITYEIAPGEDPTHKTVAALAKIVSRYDDVEQNTAWQALSQVLTGSNEAPLKKDILAKNLGEDVELSLITGIQQPCAVILVRNTTKENAPKALQQLQLTAADLVRHGLDHEELLATLNQLQFQYLEKKEPAGVMFADAALSSWLYDGDPALYLDCGGVFETLKQKVSAGYFEQLLADFLLDSEHLCSLTALPDVNAAKQRQQKEEAALASAKAGWGTRISEYIALNQKLDAWQAAGDTPEQLSSLPKLTLADVDPKLEAYEPTPEEIDGAQVLVYPKTESGIVYLNLYFSLGGITRDRLPAVSFLSALLKELPTAKKSVQQLQSEIRRDLGSLTFSTVIQRSPDNAGSCIPLLAVSCSVLPEKLPRAAALIEEILQETVFTAKTVQPLLLQKLNEMRQELISSGHSAAAARVSAHLSADGVGREFTAGYSYGEYLRQISEEKGGLEEFLNEAQLCQQILFARSRLTISFTDPENKDEMTHLIDSFVQTDARRCTVRYPLLTGNGDGITIPAQVGYTAYGANLKEGGSQFDGSYRVLGHLLSYGYLWNEIRVKGGAYGTGFNVQPNSNVFGWSFRDPNAAQSLQTFRGCAQFLKAFAAEKQDLSSFIIGAIAATEPLLSPGDMVRAADARFLVGLSYQDRCQQRMEMLTTENEDLQADAAVLEKAFAHGTACVIGSPDVLNACTEEHLTIYQPL